jgi:hypothetical protein
MTYPPQGPYGQQPDPYGQQQPQQPQQPQWGGGYAQPAGQGPGQQGQYGGYDPNAQYGGGYQQYGGLGGPQPPKSNKGPIIAVISIVVLILAGVGITGFVAPGFFLSDDKGNTAGGGSTTAKPKESGADAFINKLVAAADDKNEKDLEALQCSDASSSVTGATKNIDDIDGAKLKDTQEKSDKEVVATLDITVDGDAKDYEVTVVKDGAKWCWQDISQAGSSDDSSTEETTSDESTSDAPTSQASGDTDGEKFVQSFLDKLNSGDGAGAAAMSCSDSTSQSDITEAAGQGAQLQMDPNGTTADPGYVGADLIGTLGGAEVTSARTSAFTDDAGNWCIYTFYAS